MSVYANSSNNNPIDVVIAWVDGSDPKLTSKRNSFLTGASRSISSGAHSTLFASLNEIRYCVLSIFRFAPFVRNIFIVTDEQDPGINDDVKKYFPERMNSVRIVDHKEIFEGYEKYLPTFNSISIASMIWRIKGLSDNFVYFNDDVILIRDIKPEDFFINGRPVLRGKWRLPPYRKILGTQIKVLIHKYLRKDKDYQPKTSFYIRQWETASLYGMKMRYFFHCHTPHPINKSTIEKFFSENSEMLERNISYRFRSQEQFLMISSTYHLEILNGNRHYTKLNLGYLHPYYSTGRLNRRIRRCEADPDIKFVCVQNLDMIGKEEQKKIFSWMDRMLSLR